MKQAYTESSLHAEEVPAWLTAEKEGTPEERRKYEGKVG
jgi:hypothetical protein